MQVDHLFAAGRLMQAVDVLGDEPLSFAQDLEPGERAMGGVGDGGAKAPPAKEAARPVAAPGGFALRKGLVGHRLGALPLALGVAIVRDAGGRAAARAGQHEEPPVTADESFESA